MLSYETNLWLNKHKKNKKISLKSIGNKNIELYMTMFKEFDEFDTGLINIGNLKKSIKELELNEDSKILLDKFVNFKGKKFGFLDFEEFVKIISSSKSHYQLSDEKQTEQWLKSIINYTEAMRRHKILHHIKNNKVDDDKFKLYNDLFTTPDYLEDMKKYNSQIEENKLKEFKKDIDNKAEHLLNERPDFINTIIKSEEMEDSPNEIANKSLELSRKSSSRSVILHNKKPNLTLSHIPSTLSSEIVKSPIVSRQPSLTSPIHKKSPRHTRLIYTQTKSNPTTPHTRSYAPFPPLVSEPFTDIDIEICKSSRRKDTYLPNLSTVSEPSHYQYNQGKIDTKLR